MMTTTALIAMIAKSGASPLSADQLTTLVESGDVTPQDLHALLKQIIETKASTPATAAREMAGELAKAPTTPQKEKPMTIDKQKRTEDAVRAATKADYARSKKAAGFKKNPEGYNPILVRDCTTDDFFPDMDVEFFAAMNINGKPDLLLEDPGTFRMDPRLGLLYAVSIRVYTTWKDNQPVRHGVSMDKSGFGLVAFHVTQLAPVGKFPDHKFDEIFAEASLVPKSKGTVISLKMDRGTITQALARMAERTKFNLGEGLFNALSRKADNEAKADTMVATMKDFMTMQYEERPAFRLDGFFTVPNFNKSKDKEGNFKNFKTSDGRIMRNFGGTVTSFALWLTETYHYEDLGFINAGGHRIWIDKDGVHGTQGMKQQVEVVNTDQLEFEQAVSAGDLEKAFELVKKNADPETLATQARVLMDLFNQAGRPASSDDEDEGGLPC